MGDVSLLLKKIKSNSNQHDGDNDCFHANRLGPITDYDYSISAP